MRQFVGRLALLLALTAAPAFGQVGSEPMGARCFAADFRTEAHDAIQGYARIAGIPGVSIGVVVQDTLVYADGVGYANKQLRVPATADTPYRSCGNTERLTGTPPA